MPALVSVVIPTIHRPQLVLRAVRSVLNQTLRDLELIVVIDGDDPETGQALDSINDPRFQTIILRPGQGCSGARNAGVRAAQAQWIAFLDDDDEWFPRKLERQMETARLCTDPFPIISCRLVARSPEGDLVWPLRTPAAGEPMGDYLFCQHGLRGGEGLVLMSAFVTTRELLLRTPFPPEVARHQDIDWLLRAAAVEGVKVIFIPDPEPLGIWYLDTNRPRTSNTDDWRYSLDWIRRNRALVTANAYASFLLTWASSTGARGRRWKAFWMLPREAFLKGRPRPVDLLAHLTIWLVPRKLRSSVSVMLASWGSKKAQPAVKKTNNG